MKRFLCFSCILLFSLLAGISYADFTGIGHVHTLSETQAGLLES